MIKSKQMAKRTQMAKGIQNRTNTAAHRRQDKADKSTVQIDAHHTSLLTDDARDEAPGEGSSVSDRSRTWKRI